jgi:hypothetical protein
MRVRSTLMTEDASLRTRLQRSLGPVLPSDLRAHLDRDAVWIVGPSLSLLDCAVAIAEDDTTGVSSWLADGSLRRPTADERARWPGETARRWLAVVVQPFVLVQEQTGSA